MGRLLLLFVVVPAAELALLIEVGGRIGTPATLALIVVTGVVGANLARAQGLGVARTVQRSMNAGQLPGAAVVDGVIILIAGALLITPGILTDAVGFACLVPAVRGWIRAQMWRRFQRAVESGNARVWVDMPGAPDGPLVDVTPEARESDPPNESG